MANKRWTHLKLKNGDNVSFIPPAPDGAQLGGITQSQRESISQIQPLKSDVEQVKTDVEQVKQDVTQVKDDILAQQRSIDTLDMNKLSSPNSGLAVGKYFKIAAIDEDGRAVLEAVDLPMATGYGGTPGVINTWGDYGLSLAGYRLQVNPANDEIIDAKASSYRPIVPKNLDRAIRAGLLSNSQITDADKGQICQTIGAARKLRKIKAVKIESDGIKNISVNTDDDGNSFDVHRIVICGYVPNTGNSNTVSFAINTSVTDATGSYNIIKVSINNSSIYVQIEKLTYWHAHASVANGGENATQVAGNAYVSNRGASGVRAAEWESASSLAISCSNAFGIGTNFDIFAE